MFSITKHSGYQRRYNWRRRGWDEEEQAKAQKDIDANLPCSICNSTHNLHVDHCHKTNKYRGILCQKCNRALGFFQDSRELLLKAIEYIDKEGKVVYH